MKSGRAKKLHAGGEACKRYATRCRVSRLLLLLLVSCGALPAWGNPTGGVVVSGDRTSIRGEGTSRVTITSRDQRSILHWNRFSNSAGEVVRFDLPASAVSLNRVTGSDRSIIGGRIEGTGHVMLVNPNGISITRGGVVDLTSFTATTSDILDQDFLRGDFRFTLPGKPGAEVSNAGTISVAEAGLATLVAPMVRNSGEINARLGRVTLAAGDTFSLDFNGDGLLAFQVNNATAKQLLSQNTGRVQADGGRILMTAAAAVGTLDSLVANSGTLQARTVRQNADGTIELLGSMQNGRLEVGGTLDTSAPDGGNGGFIETSAAFVHVDDDIRVTSQADQGKTGTWLIDPLDFTIFAGSGSQTSTGIGATTLSNQLNANTVDVTIQNAPGAGNGDIFVNGAVSWSTDRTLTLNASRSIQLNSNLSNSGSGSRLNLTTGTGGSLSGTGGIASNGTLTINNASGSASTYAGAISGNGVLVLSGQGTLALTSPNNSFSGSTIVNTGTLQISGAGRLGSGNYSGIIGISSGGNLRYSSSADQILSGNISISGAGSLTKDTSTTSNLALTGSNIVGDMTVSAGTLQIGNGGTSGNVTGNITNNATLAFNRSDAVTYAGTISGTGAVNKLAGNTLALIGNNTYTGVTTISDGTLQIGGSGRLGQGTYAGAINVSSGAMLRYSSNESQTLSGVISGGGALVKDTLGSTLTLTGNNTFTGATTVSAGTLQVGNGGSSGSIAGDINNNATLAFNRSTDSSLAGNITGTGVVNKLGAGTLTLTGNNTYSGDTTVWAGTLRAGSAGAFSAASAYEVKSSTTLDLAGYSNSLGALADQGSVINSSGAATLTVGGLNTDTEFGGSLRDSGGTLSLTKTGSGLLKLSAGYGVVNYSGKTTVEAGTLEFIGKGALYNGVTSKWTADNIIVNSGATLALGNSRNGGFSVSEIQSIASLGTATGGFLSGSSLGIDVIEYGAPFTFTYNNAIVNPNGGNNTIGLTKLGTGELVLSGANTYTGKTNVVAGELKFTNRSSLYNGDTSQWTADNITVRPGTSLELYVGGANQFNAADVHILTGLGTAASGFLSGSTLRLFNTSSSGVFDYGFDIANPNGGANALGINLTSGSFRFSGNNSHTGPTTINGTLIAGSSTALNSNTAVSLYGTLNLNGYNLAIGSLEGNSISGKVTTTGGAATLTVGGLNIDTRFSGSLQDSGNGNVLSLVKQGSGTLDLYSSGLHTYSGSTTVNAGTLRFSQGATLSSGNYAGNIILAAGGTLDYSGGDQVFSGSLTGDGTLLKGANSSSLLTLSGANPFTGKTVVEGGTLNFHNKYAFYNNDSSLWTADDITVKPGATLSLGVGTAPDQFSVAEVEAIAAINSPTGGFQLGSYLGMGTTAGDFTYDRNLVNPTMGLRVLGNNTLLLTGNNTYGGPTFVDEGTLKAGSTGAFSRNSAYTLNLNTTLDLAGFNNSIGSLSSTFTNAVVTTTTGPATLSIGGAQSSTVSFTNFYGALQDGGSGNTLSLFKEGVGTLILGGSTNNYTGTTTVQSGTLRLDGNGRLRSGNYSGDIAIETAGTLQYDSDIQQTFSGKLSGGGKLVKGDSTLTTSVLTLTGDNAGFTGKTIVDAGTLAFGNRGALYGADVARWTAAGNIEVKNNGILALAVGNTGEFTPADVKSLVGVPAATGIFQPGSAIGIYSQGGANITISNADDAFGSVLINVNTTTLQALLANASVNLYTRLPGGGSETIEVKDNFAWGANTLGMTAGGDININAAMIAFGNSKLNLFAGSDASGNTSYTRGLVLTGFNSDATYGFGNGFKGMVNFCVAADCNAASGLRSGSGILNIGRNSGSLNGYSLVKDVTQLQNMNGFSYYALAGDIDASATSSWNGGLGFNPISNLTTGFNGLGHVIQNLRINRPNQDSVGLYSSAFQNSYNPTPYFMLGNVGFEGGTITGKNFVGSLIGNGVGSDETTKTGITNSYSTATVNGSGKRFASGFEPGVGGLAGTSDVNHSYTRGSVNGIHNVGGVTGTGEVSDVYATGNVTGIDTVGGVVGQGRATNARYGGSSPDPADFSVLKGSGHVGGIVGKGDVGEVSATSSRAENVRIVLGDDAAIVESKSLTYHKIGGLVGSGSTLDSTAKRVSLDLTLTGDNAGKTVILSQVGGLIGGSDTGLNAPKSIATKSIASDISINIQDNTTPTSNPHPPSITGARIFDIGGLIGQGQSVNSSAGGTLRINQTNPAGRLTRIENVGGLIGNQAVTGTPSGATTNATGSSADVDIAITTGDGTQKNNVYAKNIGGLIGYGAALDSHATGDVSVTVNLPNESNQSSGSVGGLVGYGTASGSDATGDVITNVNNTGGLIGYLSAELNNSWASGNVSGRIGVGGLVGNAAYAAIKDSFYDGMHTAINGLHSVGGLVGLHIPRPETLPAEVKPVTNSHYNVDTVNINGAHQVTLGGLYNAQYQAWKANGKSLSISSYFTQDANGYYLVNNAQQLGDMLGFIDGRAAYRFKLTADIDLREVAGGSDAPFNMQEFWAKEFNGGGHTLSHFALNQETDAGGNAIIRLPNHNQGFIGYLPNDRVLSNLTLSGALTGENSDGLGGVVGTSYSNIDTVTANTRVTALVNDHGGLLTSSEAGSSYVGGLAGYSAGEINHGHHVGDIHADASSVGGLAGHMIGNHTIGDLSHSGRVNGSGARVGGLFGWLTVVSIDNAVAEGAISGGNNVGGLMGEMSSWGATDAEISGSSFTGSVSGGGFVGGLAGRAGANIMNSHAGESAVYGNLIAGSGNFVGGLVGQFESKSIQMSSVENMQIRGADYVGGLIGRTRIGALVDNSHVRDVDVRGGSYVGGLAGEANGISNSHATGTITARGSYAGGLAGRLISPSGATKSFFIGNVEGDALNSDYVGGLLGSGSAYTSFARTGRVTGHDYVGGLLGGGEYAEYAFADIGQVIGNDYVGGFSGTGLNIPLDYSYRTYVAGRDPGAGKFNVSGNNYVGGHTGSGSALESYASVTVSGNSNVGGFSGELYAYFDPASDYYDSFGNYWNSAINPTLNGDGSDPTHQGVTGLTDMTRMASYQTLDTTNYPPDAPLVPWSITDHYVAGNYDPASPDYQTIAWRIYEGHSAPLLTAFLTPLNVTTSDDSKTYNGQSYEGSSHYTLGPTGPNRDTFWHPASGVSAGVVSGLLDSTGVDAGSYALTIQNVTGKGLYSSQSGGANLLGYDLYGKDATLTIDRAKVTVTANNQNKIYGDTFTFSGTEFTDTGLVGGQTIDRAVLASAGAPSTANVGNHDITIGNAIGTFNPDNYDMTYDKGTLTVTPRDITLTAGSNAAGSRVYGDASNPAVGYTVGGLGMVNGDNAQTLLGFTVGSSANNLTNAGVYGPGDANAYKVNGTSTGVHGNYNVTALNDGTLTVTPRDITLGAGSNGVGTRSYGDASNPTVGYTVGGLGMANGENAQTLLGFTVGSNANNLTNAGVYGPGDANAYKVNGTSTGVHGNYNLTALNDGTLTIDRKTLAISADHQEKSLGDSFIFKGTEFSSIGLVNGETIQRVDLASTGAPSPASAGEYVITIANAGGGSFNPANYTVSYIPGTLKVVGSTTPPDLPQPAVISPYQWLSFANGVAVDPDRPLSKVEYDPLGQRDALKWVESYLADTSLVDPAMLSGIVEYKPLEVEISFDHYWTRQDNRSR